MKPCGFVESVCGIDLGTQSVKVLIYRPETRSILASAQAPLSMISEEDGTREQEASWYAEALDACFSAIPDDMKKGVAALGVSGQQHGFVPLDAEGKPIRPVKLWCDTSTAAECAELTEAAGGEAALLAETGMPMLPGYTAPKILWLKRHEPERFLRLRHVLLPHDYLNYLLTGSMTAEAGDASGTALFDIRARAWSSRIASLIDPGLPSMLPPVISHDATAGRVSGAASLRWGLPEGALVSCGGGDNMMSAIGTGTLEDGLLAMSLGTSGTLFGHSDKPIVDPSVRLAAFCSSTGAWLPLLCTMNCTVASEQIRSLLSLGLEGFNALAESARPGAGGLVVLPFFNGERVPNLPHGRASVQGARADNFTAANLARAAMESAIFGMKAGLEAFTSQGFSAREIRLTGGGSKSRLWRQLTADIMGLPVRVPRVDEAAAMGAAFQAQFCLERSSLSAPEASRGSAPRGIVAIARDYLEAEESGLIHPDPEAAGYYERAYQSYVQYLEALSPLYR